MKRIINKLTNIKILLLLLLLFNEYTLSFLDKTPPLSEDSILSIRKIQFFIIILFIYVKFIFLNEKFNFFHIKLMIFIKNLSYIIILIIFLDIVLKFFGFGINSHWYDKNDKWYVTPYDMFSNKPNILDHNTKGFRGPDLSFDVPKEVYSIAFLGGSTGYRGNPPIPELLSLNLINMGINNIVYNFSSNSSNHNQHIHRLIKFIEYRYDLIIFYGGNNESIQHLRYDTRVGFPYNYFMKNDIPEYKVFLLKYSSIVGVFEKYTGIFTGINKKRKNLNNNFNKWSDSIVINYIDTLDRANMIFTRTVNNNLCKKIFFMPILQPVNPITEMEKKLWNNVINGSKKVKNLIDYSDMYKDINFIDNVHVDQASKAMIAKRMAKDIEHVYINNCNLNE